MSRSSLAAARALSKPLQDGDILPPRLEAFKDPFNFGIGLRYCQQTVGGGTVIAGPPVLTKYEKGQLATPFMTVEPETAQMLMDSLWDCGLRPSEGTGSAGAMAAVYDHLQTVKNELSIAHNERDALHRLIDRLTFAQPDQP